MSAFKVDNRKRVHDYSLRPCPECGTMFRPNKNQAIALGTGRQKTCYCSQECFLKHTKSKKVLREPKPVSQPLSTQCPYCGKTFIPNSTQRSELRTGRQKSCYCSPECYRKNIPLIRSGENNPHWKGGKADSYGYTVIHKPGYHQVNKYVSEHRLVAEKMLGRKLREDEIVHHLNEDKKDNRPENLLVMSRDEHLAYHNHERKVARGNSSKKSG